MKHRLDWEKISRSELAEHLQSADIISSQALEDTSVYHCQHTNGETIVVALPGGNGLLIGTGKPAPPAIDRRKQAP